MTARCRGAGNDGEGDTDGEAPANLEDTAEGCGTGLVGIDVERSDGCYAGEAGALSVYWLVGICGEDLHIEEDSCCLCHTLSEPTWSRAISV